ncbi:MAG: hypothetical protein ABR575_03375 [Actinomycetota bacterium]
MTRHHRDERGVITSWLLKIVIGLAIFSVVIYDAGSIAVNFFGVDSAAEEIAVEISTDIASGVQLTSVQIEDRARELARERKARLLEATLDPEGVLVIKLRRRADTLIVGRISAVRHWARATGDARSGTRPSA